MKRLIRNSVVARLFVVIVLTAIVAASVGLIANAQGLSVRGGLLSSARSWAGSMLLVKGDGPVAKIGRRMRTALMLDGAQTQDPTVQTSQPDYAPNTQVIISGAGWDPFEVVDLTLTEVSTTDPSGWLDPPYTDWTNADENGNIYYDKFWTDDHDAGVLFNVKATGHTYGKTAETTFTDASAALNTSQCANGTAASPNNCSNLGGSDGWVSGNVNQQKAHYAEGGSVIYQAVVTGSGATVATPLDFTIALGYDTRNSGSNAIDYLTYPYRANETVAVDPCAGVGTTTATGAALPNCLLQKDNSGTANPVGVTEFDLAPSIGPLGTTPLACYGPNAGDTGFHGTTEACQSWNDLTTFETARSHNMVIAGGTITNVIYSLQQPFVVGGVLQAATETRVLIRVHAYADNFVISFGGHIASRLDWGFNGGTPNSAGGINGSPYHLHQRGLCSGGLATCTTGTGSADLQLAAAAISAPNTVTIRKTTVPSPDANVFSFTTTGAGYNPFTLTNGTSNVQQPASGTYTVNETSNASYSTSASCIAAAGGATSSVNGTTVTFVMPAGGGGSVDCTYTNTKLGSITIVKNTTGGDGTFAFTGNTGVSSLTTTGGTASQTVSGLAPGSTYNVSETAQAGWTLTASSCTNGTPAAITVVSGQTTTCTFENSKKGSIVLIKNTTGGDGTFAFTTTGGGGLSNTSLTTTTGTKSQTFTNIDTTLTYSIAETAQAGWTLTNSSCSSGTPGSFTVAPGATVTCTFANTKAGSIVLVKNTTGGDGTFAFTTTGGGGLSNTSLTTTSGTKSQTFTNIDPTLTYSIAETAQTGWQLESSNCSSGTPGSFTVAAGATVTCTFINKKQSTIVLVKNTVGGDGTFAFTTTGGGLSNTSLTTAAGTASQTFTNINPNNTYSIAETAQAGWQLENSICSAGTPSSFTVAAGATVTCTFTNKKQATVILVKNTLGGDRSFSFTTTGGLGGGAATLTTVGGTVSQTFTNINPNNSYSISETVPANWQLESSICTTGTPANFTPPAGGTVTCTFINARQGRIILVKNTVGGDGTFAFTTTGGGGLANTSLTTAAGTASQTFTGINPDNTFSIAETVPAGWQLTSAACSAGAPGSFTVAPGATVTCTFTNTRNPTLTVTKTTVPANDPGLFNLAIDGTVFAANVGNGGSTGPQVVTIGQHAASETAGTGTILAAYVPSYGGACDAQGNVTLAAGDNKTCTITNTRKSTLTLTKVVGNNHGGTKTPADFPLTAAGALLINGLNGTAAVSHVTIPSGNYLLSELNLPGYIASQWNCDVVSPRLLGDPTLYRAAVQSRSPLAYWHFDEAGGTTLADSSGNGHTLTLPSVTYGVAGATGVGSTGIGLSNAVMTTAPPMDLSAGPVSFEWWMRPGVQGGDGYGALVGADDLNSGLGFYLQDDGSGGVNLNAFFTGDQRNTTTLVPGTLYHIVAAVDAAGHGTWYVNGAADGTFTYTGLMVDSLFNTGALESLHAGLFDELAIYPTTLGAGTVATHFGLLDGAYSAAVLADGAAAYWKFDEASGTTFADATGHGHTLALPAPTFGVPGAIGGATGLGITNAVAIMATPLDLSVGQPRAFEFWINPMLQGGDGYGAIIGGDNLNSGLGFYLQDNGSGGVNLNAFFNGDQRNNTALVPGTLYHVVAAVNAAGQGVWFVNGVPDGTFTYTGLQLDSFFSTGIYENLKVNLLDELAIYGPSFTPDADSVSDFALGATVDTQITVGLGQNITCSITNNDQPAHLTLVKHLDNSFNGPKVLADFLLTATGPDTISGASGTGTVTNAAVSAGTYILSEPSFAGYAASPWTCTGAVPVVGQDGMTRITLALNDSATCEISNTAKPAHIVIVKNSKGGPGSFDFTVNGPSTPAAHIDTVGTPNGTGTTGSIDVKAGSYTVSELVPSGWTLTGLTCDAGAASHTNIDGIDDNWTFNVANDATVTCTFDNTSLLTTRTQGFWQTHTKLANDVWNGISAINGATPLGADALLCTANPITATTAAGTNQLMGGFFASIPQTSTGGKRSPLDSARMKMLQQYFAAVLNVHAFGAGTPNLLSNARAAYCGNNQNAIMAQVGILDAFNNSGDAGIFTPGTSASPATSKQQANIAFWNTTLR